jgi:bile acid-coenzyme A ligase
MLSFPARLARLAHDRPDAPAITCADRTLTRAGLESAANRLARELASHGVGYGDFVTIAVSNSLDWFVSYVACWKLGAVPQPVSAKLPARELDAIVELAESKVVIGAPDVAGSVISPHAVHLPLGHQPAAEFIDDPLPDAVSPA